MPKRIFIVDDSNAVRRVVRTHLEANLEDVVCAESANGRDAVQRAREVDPDLIVLDLSMPFMNGLEAAAALHNLLPRVPIILFTLHKESVPEIKAHAAGIRAVISKVDPIDVLLEEILNYAGLARAATA